MNDKEIIADLQKKIQHLESENSQKDEIVIQQSKMASMGEMIENIAHQWRQPLMEISSLLMGIEAKIKLENEISQDNVLTTIDKSNYIIKYMSNTIDDFRNFFATDKEKEEFIVAEQVSLAINIVNSILVDNNIKIDLVIKGNIRTFGYKNEYSQVIINIISNAKDIIIARGIKDGKIIIRLYEKNSHIILEIEDNGGGVHINPIDKVFEPFFTYKKSGGTGIGLFMSKLIIENNMKGELTVENINNGVCFTVKSPVLITQ